MNKINWGKLLPHFLVIMIFVIISMGYFSPLLQGKKLHQGDIVNYIGSAKEINDYRAKGIETKWTNAMFGGMPSYMISVKHNYNFIGQLDKLLRFLPRPADYVFLYFISFYLLLLVLHFRTKQALIGALAFGLSSYFFIILGAGHNSKAHAIGYFPLVVAGVLIIFKQKKHLLGILVSTLAIALEINANHYQMTYYLMLALLVFVIIYGIDAIKQKKLKIFGKAILSIFIASVLALSINITKLWSTYEYSEHTIRGKSELTISENNQKLSKRDGLDKNYITQWSYGKMETLNLFIPNFMGGSSTGKLPKDGEVYNALKNRVPERQLDNLVNHFPTYWGEQPFTEGPAYIGSIVILLFILGCFLVKGKMKWWLISTTLFSLFLSWGKNLSWLTDFFIDYVPFYNKFRSVSSIQVIAEFTVPLLGILALKNLFDKKIPKIEKQKSLKKSGIITVGLCLFFYLFGSSLFSFEGINDKQYTTYGLPMDMAVLDRITLFKNDCLRTILFLVGALGVLYFYIQRKLKSTYSLITIALLVVLDLGLVNKRYVNDDDFVKAKRMKIPFQPTAADLQILKDKTIYRVFNTSVNTMQDASTSYFHHSVGGYHAAKLMRYQQLYDFHISKMNREVINMLNVKYLITKNKNGQTQTQLNSQSNGNAWVVNQIKTVKTADEEILALSNFNSKKEAIVDIFGQNENITQLKTITNNGNNSAQIKLTNYQPHHLEYEFKGTQNSIAVFSEIYYQKGWNAYIDGETTPHFRANFVLRGLVVPKGKHKIEFKFEPQSFYIGDKITLVSYLFLLVLFGFVVYRGKRQKNIT